MDEIRRSVVQIRVFSQAKDPYSPWANMNITSSTGTGFFIGKNQILTNAHVISNAKFLEAQRHNQTEWYELQVRFVAHDCDLAILEAKDSIFSEEATTLELGDVPELASPVDIIGYPIGGSKISVSRGIVSRIEQSTYAHSQIDSHLVIQVDAAINPGNSGGPALQDGKIVGVAFQAATKGENIGYIIPVPVIKHFLTDIQDGKYDGYVELGIQTQPGYSVSQRKFHKIPDGTDGVFVTKVLPGGSAFGYLEAGDFLVSIDGKNIGKNGNLADSNTVDFLEIVDQKYAGEEIRFELFRKGKQMSFRFPAKKMPQMELQRARYGIDYDYLLWGGLVFQTVHRDLLESWSKSGQTQSGSYLVYRFYYAYELRPEGYEDVVLYRKLPHPFNSYMDYYLNLVVQKVNDVPIKNLSHFRSILQNNSERYLKVFFYGTDIPLVLDMVEAKKANDDILKMVP